MPLNPIRLVLWFLAVWAARPLVRTWRAHDGGEADVVYPGHPVVAVLDGSLPDPVTFSPGVFADGPAIPEPDPLPYVRPFGRFVAPSLN